MSIAGTGIDIVEVARIERAIGRHGERFVGRVFTRAEAKYCRSRGAPAQHFAGRFAVKEATLKALGTGWSRGVAWRDVEVSIGPDGAPSVTLSGAAARRATEMNVIAVHVSISHTGGLAVAQAIAEARESCATQL